MILVSSSAYGPPAVALRRTWNSRAPATAVQLTWISSVKMPSADSTGGGSTACGGGGAGVADTSNDRVLTLPAASFAVTT